MNDVRDQRLGARLLVVVGQAVVVEQACEEVRDHLGAHRRVAVRHVRQDAGGDHLRHQALSLRQW